MMRVFFSVGLGNGRSTPSPSRRQSAHIMPRFRRVDPAATIAAVPRTRPGSRHDLPGPASRADVVLASRTATRAKQPCLGRIAMRSTTATPPPGPRGWPAPDSVLRTLGSRLYQPLVRRFAKFCTGFPTAGTGGLDSSNRLAYATSTRIAQRSSHILGRIPGGTLRGCEKIGTGTFATADFPGFSWFRLGASPIFSQPLPVRARITPFQRFFSVSVPENRQETHDKSRTKRPNGANPLRATGHGT
jgi:hypothetical protein